MELLYLAKGHIHAQHNLSWAILFLSITIDTQFDCYQITALDLNGVNLSVCIDVASDQPLDQQVSKIVIVIK